MAVEVTGIEAAQAALAEALRDVNLESELLVTVILQGIRAETIPYVPVDTSFLVNSEFMNTRMTQNGAEGEIGYGAEYAVYVHEGPQKNWQKPGASNRFLELGVRDFIQNDLDNVLRRFESR